MKKLFLLYIIVAGGMGFNFSFAQAPAVGINTTKPQGPFHVDAKGDTQGGANTSDDVIVDKSGNLGIGTLTPTAKVHIKTDGNINGIRISDESEDKGSMLMFQDNTGVVNWVPKPFTIKQAEINGDFNMNVPFPRGANDHREISITGKGLKLPPGVWMIMAKYMVYNHGNDEGKLYWTYLHDLDDLSTVSYDSNDFKLKNKRAPCFNDSLQTDPSKCSSWNKNWYLASGGIGGNPSQHAMSVVGVYPEAKSQGYTTPYINYIAVIQSPGKKPGEPGYEHEIALTFSTSLNGTNELECKSSIPGAGNGGGDLPVGVYFFAVRLDIDEDSLQPSAP
jgi:hypothetical protein